MAEAAEIVWRRGERVEALVDNLPVGGDRQSNRELGVTFRIDELNGLHRTLSTSIPLITPGHRWTVLSEARALGFDRFPPLVDPTAVVARTAVLGIGTSINAHSVVSARCNLGQFVLVNRTASIGHDSEIHDFVTIGPGALLAGHVVIESGAFLGVGCIISPKVRVGRNAIVGAGAVVIHDVPSHSVVVGAPARVTRQTESGYGNVSIAFDALTLN